ncbi:MAG: hypothetical protein KGP28_03565 [Bdellovibrionales bacterium]|nr:hypothetical protein [Bdellovibrionales bacterium]
MSSGSQSTGLAVSRALFFFALFSGPLSHPAFSASFSCRDLLVHASSLIFGHPVPKKSEVIIQSPMIELFNTHSIRDPEILRLFTRHPKEKLLSRNYIQNIKDSIQESFAPWFEGQSADSFQKMLKLQHTILAMGLDGRHPYLSTSKNQPLGSRSIGRFRHEKSSLFLDPNLLFNLSEYFKPDALPPALRSFLEEIDSSRTYPVAIASIPENQRPICALSVFHSPGGYKNYSIRYRYPPSQHTGVFVEKLEDLMTRMRKIPLDGPKDELIEHLADYIQVFAAGLPFERVNYSIAMAQANYILMKHGFRGMENGELDLLAVIVPTPVFRLIFADAVKNAQH